ncbi:MAG: hypothetical protein ABI591_33705 [Kofleriaceae bacterium]
MRALVLALVMWFATPAHAVPLIALPGGDRISISYEDGLESTARRIRAGAEESLTRIATDLQDLPQPRHIRIQLVRDASSIASVAPAGRGAPAYAIGVTYPDLGVVTIAMRRGADVVDPMSTLDHELGHVALGAALGERAPHWLHEGFAYQHSAEWSWDRAETLAGMVWLRGIIPLEQLDRSFPAEESPANRAYAESYDFVNFLSRRGRWEDHDDDGDRWPFRRFLAEISHGTDIDAAAKHQFGKPLHELFEEWRDDVQDRYLSAPAGLLGLAVWILCAILLVFAWMRRRGINRRRIAQWDLEEQLADAARRREAAERAERLRPVIELPPEDPKVWN